MPHRSLRIALAAGLLLVGAALYAFLGGRLVGRSDTGPADGPAVFRHTDAPAPLESAYPVRSIRLTAVSNASGMVLMRHRGALVVATVDEVSEWGGAPDRPPLVTLSNPLTGAAVGGIGEVARFGEVEALALRRGRIAFPYKTDAQRLLIRDGDRDIPAVTAPVIAALERAAQAVAPGPHYFEFEGLAWDEAGWQFVVSALRGGQENGPKETQAVFRLWLHPTGGIDHLSPALRRRNGQLRTDYAAALWTTPEDNALIPGFYRAGVPVYDPTGREVRRLATGTTRIEGVDYDPATRRLFLVRECVADGLECATGVHFGVPLYVVTLPFDL